MHAKNEARGCLDILKLSTSVVQQPLNLSASSGSCTCFAHFQHQLKGDADDVHVERGLWLLSVREHVARITFLGSVTMAVDVKDKRVVDVSIFCSESWVGVLRSGPFWSRTFGLWIILYSFSCFVMSSPYIVFVLGCC